LTSEVKNETEDNTVTTRSWVSYSYLS